MDLALFFNSLDEYAFMDIQDENALYKQIKLYTEDMPEWKNADLAIIGLLEERGTLNNKGVAQGAHFIRKELYKLKRCTGAYNIVDLGNLRNGISVEESYARLGEVCEYLLQNGVIPLIIGGSHDMDLGQYKGYEYLDKLISVVNIDAILDMNEHPESENSTNHIHKMFIYFPNFLFNFSHLAYQTYLNNPEDILNLEKFYFDTYSLGRIRENIEEIEPVIREANMISFDITAIKHQDAPGNKNSLPFGLTGEEACQICWYAGLSENVSSMGFYEYNPEDDFNYHTAKVISTMIWYFIEGFYHRKNDRDFKSNAFMRYEVALLDKAQSIVFYKHKITQKWWMEVPYPEDSGKKMKFYIVPCTYRDYQIANKGEVPNKWINTYAKLI